ncbi:MAG: histidine phosphatase family protein [Lachnospiraceae bacterium]|nr:histidine phosphatase family protein [Lachnospiraceae bacterium]
MILVFVRHGEPDYEHDSLTEKGRREAELLGKRIATWNVKDFYVSPLGRAKDTAAPALRLTGKTAEELPWAKEFWYCSPDPVTHTDHLSWDYVPSLWTSQEKNFTLDDWVDAVPMKENPEIRIRRDEVCNELDKLLLRYGYRRDGLIYRTVGRKQKNVIHTIAPGDTKNAMTEDMVTQGPVVVIFCHLGAACLMMSHLLNIPFITMPQGLFLPPASVNILQTEERWEDEASFRAQAIGDCKHLLEAGEPISSAGSYSKAFQL